MIFKSQKELEHYLLKKSRLAIMKAQDEIYKIIKQFVYRIIELWGSNKNIEVI